MSDKKKFAIKDPKGDWWYSGQGQLIWSAAGKAKFSWSQFNRNPEQGWGRAHWKDHAEPFGWKIVEVDIVEKSGE